MDVSANQVEKIDHCLETVVGLLLKPVQAVSYLEELLLREPGQLVN